MPKRTTTNTTAVVLGVERGSATCAKYAHLLLLLAHCAEHSWSSGSVGSRTAIRRRSSRERGDHDDTGIMSQPGSEKFWYLVKADSEVRTAGSDKRNQPQQNTTAILRKWVGRPHTACGRQRCNDGVRACCLLCTWYMSGRCAHSSS